MKIFRNLFLIILMLTSVRMMAQTEFNMKTGSVYIGDGKTYYFYDSGGDDEMTEAEDPENNFRWKTWYQHNEEMVLNLKVPEDVTTKGIKVTFRYLKINDDHLCIYEGNPGQDTAQRRITDLTCTDYSTDLGTFTVMSHGNMTISFKANEQYRDAGWVAIVELAPYAPQAPIVVRKACDNELMILPTCKGSTSTAIYYTIGSTATDPDDQSDSYTLGNTIAALNTYPFTMQAIAYIDGVASGIGKQTINSAIAPPTFTEAYYTHNEKDNTIVVETRKPEINDTYYVRYFIDDSQTQTAAQAAAWPAYEVWDNTAREYVVNDPDGYKEIVNPGGTIDYTDKGMTPPYYVHMLIRGTTCPTHFSAIKTVEVEVVYAPKPKIVFHEGKDTIKCNHEDAEIYYTIDNSDPTTNTQTHAPVQPHYYTEGQGADAKTLIDYYYILIDHVSPGTTVKAIADLEGTTIHNIAYAVYADGSGIVPGTSIVLLDDREDHSWSYYSDGNQPVHSLNPADVKITYFGNGKMYTSTTATPSGNLNDATGVQVSATESANQFVYLKTLERANYDGTGNLVYSLIPNPFSKRPTFTSGNTTYYTGFYGWRVKRLSGVTIDGYDEGSIIPAETEIEFVTNNSEGNEVDFEAVWARAFVFTSVTNLNNAGDNAYVADANGEHRAYERNFVVLNGNIGNTANSRPATITCLNPDGTGNVVSRTGGMFTCGADTKYEYLTFGTTGGTITANNHYLCIGRGVSGTIGNLQGINDNVGNTGLNYTIRVESGTFSEFAFVRKGTNTTVGGRVQVKAILGCDYDRARGANGNDNLTMCPTNNNNSSMFFTQLVSFTSNLNKDEKVFDCVIKSGRFQQGFWDTDVNANGGTGENAFNYRHSIYCGANFSGNVTNHYPGIRYVTVEGGEMGNINGGRGTGEGGDNDHPEATNDHATTSVVSFNLRIKKDAVINGCVFGGAANTSAWGSKRIVMTGGQVLSWIAGGANGTNTTSGDSRTRGTSYIYVGGNAQVGGPNARMKNGTLGGQVFGAGRGNTNQAASMDNSNVVIADNAKIMKKSGDAAGNVYGGGNIGYIAHESNVYILGGTIEGSVFGGAYGNALAIPSSNVTMKGGEVKGSVYGGSNSTGSVGNVTMEITGGKMDSVFGGGLGQPTIVTQTVKVNVGSINEETGETSGTAIILGDVYGGSALGTVNSTGSSNTTDVTINAGTIKGNVYGGGLGKKGTGNNNAGAIAANAGTVTVTVNGGNLNKVFGCNNQNGAPQGTVTVNFNGGEAVDVYGGGNEADYTNTAGPVVNIKDGKITNAVYGGGSLAKVYKTLVNISGGEANNVFAGAEGNKATEPLVDHIKTLNMTGGSATALYGGSYTCLDKEYSFVNISGGRVKTHVFGSGYFGNMEGSCFVYIGKNAIENAPNSNENNDLNIDKNKVTHTIDKPIWIENNVYAGANWGSFEGTFGEPTIIAKNGTGGISNIYIDGTGYNMEHGKTGIYMIIGGSVFGSGTSCAAGSEENNIIIREYGKMNYPSMSRSLKSIQQAKELVLDHSSIDFLGQGNIKSLDPTEEFGICNIGTIYATNTTNMALSKPLTMVKKLSSSTCTNTNGVYADDPTYVETGYGAATNGIVINNGGYLMVRYENSDNTTVYGELEGYFYMREPGDDAGINNEGYIFARPKLIPNNGESDAEKANTQYEVFVDDGGFVDFNTPATKNIYDADGNNVNNNNNNETPVSPINTLEDPAPATGVQMAYTNRTNTPTKDRTTDADDNTDYRFWRYEPATFPVSTREIVFVVKASDQASATSEKFLTTTGSVLLPPSISSNHRYFITGLTWGADGKDCNPAPYAAVASKSQTDLEVSGDWMTYNPEPDVDPALETEADYFPTNTNPDKSEYYANPNSTFGFLMTLKGNLTGHDPRILSDESWASHFKAYANDLAAIDTNKKNDMPELEFLVTYSDRLSQNELWSEARMIIDEIEVNDDGTPKLKDGKPIIKQRIYLNLSVTTLTKFGQNVETYVYASTVGENEDTYTAQLTLPTFGLDRSGDNANVFNAEFIMASGVKVSGFDPDINIVAWNGVKDAVSGANLALHISAAPNDDNTNGWTGHMGYENNPNQSKSFDFTTINNDTIGAADGRKYTTIKFELQFYPVDLAKLITAGQKYLGDLKITMNASPIVGGVNQFDIIVHVYVTGATKYFYLDGVAGKDGNSGMFPDEAKKTLNGVLNSSGYTIKDPIFVVNGVEARSNRTLTWDANEFADKGQVKVYRYPGNHNKSTGDTLSIAGFDNGMFYGKMVNVPASSKFSMHNVYLSGGSDLNNTEYNPMNVTMHGDFPLICIAEDAEVNIDNSSLVNNNNTCTTADTTDVNNTEIYYAGAISNYGTLTIDGVTIKGNKSNGFASGIYQKGIMNLGSEDTITIEDQVYLADDHWMDAVTTLNDESRITDIMVEIASGTEDVPDDPTPADVNVANSITRYSGRLIVRYKDIAPKAPAFGSYLPNNQKVFGSIRKAAPAYESQKYALDDELTKTGRDFKIANGADPEVLPYITSEMRAQYDPTNHDLIMANINANLPVELLYFHATCMGDAVQFEWATATETNNEYFTIERSTDAVNYEEVARIQGAGTTSQRSDYSFMADNSNSGMTYYRLRQTDIDGKYEIFAPIAIQCQNEKAATEISIYPVPANDQVNIFSSNSPMTRIEIYSIMGAKVAEEQAEGNQTTLHIGNLARGVYAVKVFTEDGQVSNARLIKK